jgi:hypothetical protein
VNVLAFRTNAGTRTVAAGDTKELGTVDVSHFDKIRLVTDEQHDCTCDVLVQLVITEEGGEQVAFLDEVSLTPGQQTTKVYDVPCTNLRVSLVGKGSPGTSGTVDVFIYGQY